MSNGEYTFTISESNPGDDDVVQLYSFFAKEKDLDVEMDLFGGGTDNYMKLAEMDLLHSFKLSEEKLNRIPKEIYGKRIWV